MTPRRTPALTALLVGLALPGAGGAQAAADRPSAVERALRPGPEAERLERLAGDWTARKRVWPGEGAEPVVTGPTGMRYEMIGTGVLQGTFIPAPGTAQEPFTRIDSLSCNRLTRRREHVGLDTRFPGLMPETGYVEPDRDDRITLDLPLFTSPPAGARS